MKILIRNLESSVTDSDLFLLFRKFGRISDINLATSLQGKSLGYAYLTMGQYKDGFKAVKSINNTLLKGMNIDAQEINSSLA
jgi:RNA recognition motif-containing protein